MALIVDGWVNILSGLGNVTRDRRLAAVFQRNTALACEELDSLYAGDWLIARACERPAADQVRRWIDVKVDGKLVEDDDMAGELKRLGAKVKLAEAITWARLHGGALLVLGVDDGLPPEEPVNEKAIKGIGWVNVIDRWEAAVNGWYGGMHPKRGEPERYMLSSAMLGPNGAALGLHVHETRTLRVDGVLTSNRVRALNSGWTNGVIQRLYDQIRDFHSALGGAAHLTTDFAQTVIKLKGLKNMLATDNDDLVKNRLLALDLARSLVRMIPLDEGEELTRVATPVAGLPELLDRLRDAVCGAVDIPEKILFGKATAGLGDQGQSDLEQYYNQIEGEQERNLVPQLTRLVGYLWAAAGGVPKKWQIVPRKLWTPTAAEDSETQQRNAQTDQIYVLMGALTPDEVRRSRFAGDEYGTSINIEGADQELDDIPSDELPAPGADPAGTDPNAPPDPTAPTDPTQVKELTGIVISAALSVVEKAVSGAITVEAARVLLKAALRLEDKDVDAMLAGVEDEQARRNEMAAKIAEGGGPGPGAPAPGQPPGRPPPPGAPPAPPDDPKPPKDPKAKESPDEK